MQKTQSLINEPKTWYSRSLNRENCIVVFDWSNIYATFCTCNDVADFFCCN